jgi:hypothetical protein
MHVVLMRAGKIHVSAADAEHGLFQRALARSLLVSRNVAKVF